MNLPLSNIFSAMVFFDRRPVTGEKWAKRVSRLGITRSRKVHPRMMNRPRGKSTKRVSVRPSVPLRFGPFRCVPLRFGSFRSFRCVRLRFGRFAAYRYVSVHFVGSGIFQCLGSKMPTRDYEVELAH